MGNFSKFIRPGSTIIGANNSNMLAAFNKDTNKLAIVVINDSTASADYSLDLSKFTSVGNSASVYRTSATENLSQLSNINISDKTLSITAAPRSITTYEISNVTASSSPLFDRTKTYRIVNKDNTSMVMDIENSSPNNSANVVIMTKDNNSISQGWKFIVDDNGNYYIANKNAAKMLDVPGASTANSATIALWQANGDNNQLWKITNLNNGYYSIINVNSNKALGVKNGTMTDGNSIDQYDFHSYENQQWAFEEIN